VLTHVPKTRAITRAPGDDEFIFTKDIVSP